MNLYDLGFKDALSKYAFNERDAAKILSMAKPKQLPKASYRALPKPLQGAGLLGLAKRPLAVADIASQKAQLQGLNLPPEHLDAVNKVTDSLNALSKKVPQGAVIPGSDPTITRFIAERTGLTPPPASQRKMLHAILKGHELDEMSMPGSTAFRNFGHRSPQVILNEHNRVATLPAGYEDTRDYLKTLRTPENTALQMHTGMRYGESPRLSRHARKRVAEAIDRNQALLANPKTTPEQASTLINHMVNRMDEDVREPMRQQLEASMQRLRNSRK